MPAALAPAEETVLRRLLPELVQLSPAARIALIHQLVDSMQPDSAPTPRKTLLDFAGAWNDNPDADKMEEAILKGRYSESKPYLEDWD